MGRSGNPARRNTPQRARAGLGESTLEPLATFYCDESGNTGAHWADPAQPVFVHGGWLIPRSNQDAVLDEVGQLRQRNHLGARELKWQQLARRDHGSAVFRDIFQVMIAQGAIPFFIVMDKDYLLAAKVVETFFDPAYNKFFPIEFSSAYDVKKQIAECLLLAPAALSEFAEMHRAESVPDASRIERLALQIADFFAVNNAPVLGNMLRHFTPEAIDDIGRELGADNWMRTTLGHSMMALMQRLEFYLRPRTVRVEIVHDNIVRFDDLLGMISLMFRDTDGSDTLVINGELRFTRMPTIDSLRLADSKLEPFIQLADLLCGFARTVCTKLKVGESLGPDECAVCSDLTMIRDKYCSWDMNVPEETWVRFARISSTDAQ